MSTVTPDTIYQEAERFRMALDALVLEGGPIARSINVSGDYPRACCGTVAEALALFLEERFSLETYVVRATAYQPEIRTHAWVQVARVNIDVTGDQNGEPPVVVSSDPIWRQEYPDQRIERHVPASADRQIVAAVRSFLASR